MPQASPFSTASASQNQANKTVPQHPVAGASIAEGIAVNRKKQKRREKQAARLAAEQVSKLPSTMNGHIHPVHQHHDRSQSRDHAVMNGLDFGAFEADDLYRPAGEEEFYYSDENSSADRPLDKGQSARSKKKNKTKSRSESQDEYHSSFNHSHRQPPASSAFHPPPPPPPLPLQSTVPMSSAAVSSAHKVSKDRIWNTSTAEERERIKEFWLSLEETERRSLVKVEKDMVLKKMKEQQKHSCSCTVCGRKRTAIEEELEVLYDAYYEELEQYANHQQYSLDDGTPIMPSPGNHARPIPRLPPNRIGPAVNTQRPARGRIEEIMDHDEEEDYSEDDEDEDDDYSEDEPLEQTRGPAADFFNFGNSLTVQGGILTVADDLLKNDGKKFIEMMEQLAERRMQREVDAQYATHGRHQATQNHDANPPTDEEDYEEDEEDEYDSQDDEDYDEDEMEAMTEEQRMEEGRRMFQIFAARMFEQRVLTAYREKVARERQEKLLEELADESRLDAQREAKKAKEAQKKKEKKRQQKQVKDEEKARREAEKAQEEAAAKAVEEQKLEEQRQKKEEQRKKREAEKKAQDEERQRKEAEKQKKIQEAREQQAEVERKQKEQKEKEKRKREDAKKKEREEREVKEREAKEKKDREAAERREKEVKAKTDKETRDRAKREEQASKQAAQQVPVLVPTLPRSKPPTTIAVPPGLQTTSSNHASPHLQVATPAIPKAPTPVRPRQTSFQDSHQSSPKSAPVPCGSSATSPASSNHQQQATIPLAAKTPQGIPTSVPNLPIGPPPGVNMSAHVGNTSSPGIPSNAFTMSYSQNMPTTMPRMPLNHETPMIPHQPPFSSPQYRSYVAPNGLGFPPGINSIRHTPPGRGSPMDFGPVPSPIGQGTIGNNSGAQPGPGHSMMPSHSHSRNTSASVDKHGFEAPHLTQTQPIARPTPIQRPSSIPHQDALTSRYADIDDLSNHLGSSALLDDTDDPLNFNIDDRRTNTAPGGLRSGRIGYGASPMFPDPIGSAKMENFPRPNQGGLSWGAPPMPFGTPSLSNPPTWSNAPGSGWSNNNAFGIIGAPNRRSGTIRLLLCQACKQLTNSRPAKSGDSYGYHNIDMLLRQVELLKPVHEAPIQLRELLTICETEGNSQNGGGTFDITEKPGLGICVKYEPDHNTSMGPRGGPVPGDIGSPIPSSAGLAFGGPRGFQAPGGGITSPGF